MLEDAQKTIFEMIVKSPFVESSVNFLKSGKISVKFTTESGRMTFRRLVDILEHLEVYEELSKNKKQN